MSRVPHAEAPRYAPLSPTELKNVIVHLYVDIPCPSGKHARSLVTFRNHTVAALFCMPCEHAWTEATTHPALQNMPLDKERA